MTTFINLLTFSTLANEPVDAIEPVMLLLISISPVIVTLFPPPEPENCAIGVSNFVVLYE